MKHIQIVKQSALSQNRFNELLGNPKQAGAQEIAQLLKIHPYSHVLWLLEAKRYIDASNNRDQEEKILNSASLYASSPEQLYGFLYADPINDFTVDNQEAVAKLDSLLHQDLTESHDEVIIDIVTTEEESTILNESVIAEATITIEEEEEKESPSLIEVSPSQEQTREDVTKYDDELMPYTFVWWLHKTRLNYADTYQPYAPKTKPNLKRLHHNISDVVLDQQIRENIFHLQSPEEKLSIKENNKTVTFNVSQKADEIIERFIKEEPQIKPPQANKITLENKAKQSAEDQSIFVSETLAQIYIEQGLYHKAIDAYMKLSLKYPEKSVYFADRIKDLKNKIN